MAGLLAVILMLLLSNMMISPAVAVDKDEAGGDDVMTIMVANR